VQWDNANDCELKLVQTDGDQALQVAIQEGDQDKAGIACAPAQKDLSAYRMVTAEMHVGSEKPLEVALAIMSDQYYETPAMELPPGTGRVVFDLTKDNFKAKPDWEHRHALQNRKNVGQIMLLFYTGESRRVVIDDVRLLP
jgi:hypothetical protein